MHPVGLPRGGAATVRAATGRGRVENRLEFLQEAPRCVASGAAAAYLPVKRG